MNNDAKSTGESRTESIITTIASDKPAFVVTEGYRYYTVWLLFVVYMLNILDRTLMTPLLEPIKRDFNLTDSQMGLLGGLAFAVFYTTLAMPLAHLADRKNRVNIIAISIVIWSVFTALTGTAKSFWHLLAARIGIGIGEAGCNPAAYSIISDYFPPKRRATALAIYHMGSSVGVFLGFIIAGYVIKHYTWHYAFFIVGIPGILVALLIKLTLREPPRGLSEAVNTAYTSPPALQVLWRLLAKSSFRHMAAACALVNTTIYGIGNFVPSYLIRSHEISASNTSYLLAFVNLIGGLIGTFLGGALSDSLANRHNDHRYYLWVPGCAMVLCFPVAQMTYATHNPVIAIAGLTISGLFVFTYLSPCLTALYRMTGIQERALASALLLLILNFVGLGLGPPIAGQLSDWINAYLVGQGMGTTLAEAEGLRWSLRGLTVLAIWGAFHFFMAARSLRKDSLQAD